LDHGKMDKTYAVNAAELSSASLPILSSDSCLE
jgi:hypothetical protein